MLRPLIVNNGDGRRRGSLNALGNGSCAAGRQLIVVAQDPDPLPFKTRDPKQDIGNKANIRFVLGCGYGVITALGDFDICKAVVAGVHLDMHTLLRTKLALNLIEPQPHLLWPIPGGDQYAEPSIVMGETGGLEVKDQPEP